MSEIHAYNCEICGAPREGRGGWFLVSSAGDRDCVSVLRWDEASARRSDMHAVCGHEHARELVARWVLSGTLCCGAQGARWRMEPGAGLPAGGPPARALSTSFDLERLEKATPDTLLSILDAVEAVLDKHWYELDEAHEDAEVLLYDA